MNQTLSMTRQRRAILDALCSVTSHPTADDVHQMVRESMPRVSLATVYRNLEMMSDAGMILKLNTAGVQKRFDGNTMPHYHIRCSECGRVDDVFIDPVNGLDDAACEMCGYVVTSHSVEFVGVCPSCAKKQR